MTDPTVIFSELLENVKEELSEDIQTSLPAKVLSVDIVKGYCTCEVLAIVEFDGEPYNFPVLVDVMLDYDTYGIWKLRKPRKVNDLVWVGFSKYAYDNLLKEAKPTLVNSQETFSLNGSYIIRGIKLDTVNLNSSYQDDLMLEGGNGTLVLIKNNGDIYMKAGSGNTILDNNLQVNGTIDSTGTITSDVDCIGSSISLVNHDHKYTHDTPLDRTTEPPQ